MIEKVDGIIFVTDTFPRREAIYSRGAQGGVTHPIPKFTASIQAN